MLNLLLSSLHLFHFFIGTSGSDVLYTTEKVHRVKILNLGEKKLKLCTVYR